jgi:predicted DNA-binding transcriptional regulator AlpA
MSDTNKIARRPAYVAEKFGISKPMIYKMIKAGEFPPGKFIDKNIRVWFDDELNAEMKRRLEKYNH